MGAGSGYTLRLPSVIAALQARLGAYTNYPGNGWNAVASVVSTFAGFALLDALGQWQVPTGNLSSCRITQNGAQVGSRFRVQFAFSGPNSGGVVTFATLAVGDVLAFEIQQDSVVASVNVHEGAHIRVVGLR